MHCLLEQPSDAVVMPLLQHGPILLSANADPFSDAADAYMEPVRPAFSEPLGVAYLKACEAACQNIQICSKAYRQK